MKLILTWTAERGLKKSGRRRDYSGPDVKAPELDLSDTDDGIDNMCLQDSIAEAGSRFSRYNKPSSEDDEKDD